MNTAHTSLQDSIKIANELGRLDFISSLLAIVAIMVGLFAIFGFAYIRNTAQSQAKNIAQQISREVSERIANEYMQDKMPEILQEYRELFKNMLNYEEADEIVGNNKDRNDEK